MGIRGIHDMGHWMDSSQLGKGREAFAYNIAYIYIYILLKREDWRCFADITFTTETAIQQ